jgi:Ser/Thr protein kinase RdoA (MazF antagonist)
VDGDAKGTEDAAVRPFDQLTPRGQLRRIRAAALAGLSQYEIGAGRCTFVARSLDTVFRVDDTCGARHALRVTGPVRTSREGAETTEAAWLEALGAEAGMTVPRMQPTRSGSFAVHVSVAGAPEPRVCTLSTWVDGRPLLANATVALLRKTGEMAARLHEHGAGYTTTVPETVITADRVLYWRIQSRLGELESEHGTLLTEATDRAQQVLDHLWRDQPSAPHILHGDLEPANVIVRHGEVAPIDFYDLTWGFEVQDLAITLCALQESDDPDVVVAAFKLGYERARAWPDFDPEIWDALVAARRLQLTNLALVGRRPGFESFVTRQAALISRWMSPPAEELVR